MKAPPGSKNYALVGTAFDYLLRFHAKHLNPGARDFEWLAEKAVAEPMAFGGSRDFELIGKKIMPDARGRRDHKRARLVLKDAKRHYRTYLNERTCTDALLRSVLLLAQLDTVMRASGFDFSWSEPYSEDIRDLRCLLGLVEPRHFKMRHTCILNPTFGKASELVGGADADILLDTTLIDIKTTKYFEAKRKWFDQLLGYYLLYRIGGMEGVEQPHKIDRPGIYFSRHGYLWTFKVQEMTDERRMAALAKWFVKRASREFS